VGAELRVLLVEDRVLTAHVAQRHVRFRGVHAAVDGGHRGALHWRGHAERDPIDEIGLPHPAARAEKHPQRVREDEADQQGFTVTLEEGQHELGGFSLLRKRLYFHSRSPRGSRMLPEAGCPLAATGEHLADTPRCPPDSTLAASSPTSSSSPLPWSSSCSSDRGAVAATPPSPRR